MTAGGTYATAVSCLDGRIHDPLIRFIRARFGVQYVDLITESGPVRIILGEGEGGEMDSIIGRIQASMRTHGSRLLFIVSHHDCAGDPVGDRDAAARALDAAEMLDRGGGGIEVWGLFVEGGGTVRVVYPRGQEHLRSEPSQSAVTPAAPEAHPAAAGAGVKPGRKAAAGGEEGGIVAAIGGFLLGLAVGRRSRGKD